MKKARIHCARMMMKVKLKEIVSVRKSVDPSVSSSLLIWLYNRGILSSRKMVQNTQRTGEFLQPRTLFSWMMTVVRTQVRALRTGSRMSTGAPGWMAVKKIRSKRAKTKRPRASMVATMLRRVGGIPTCFDFRRL